MGLLSCNHFLSISPTLILHFSHDSISYNALKYTVFPILAVIVFWPNHDCMLSYPKSQQWTRLNAYKNLRQDRSSDKWTPQPFYLQHIFMCPCLWKAWLFRHSGNSPGGEHVSLPSAALRQRFPHVCNSPQDHQVSQSNFWCFCAPVPLPPPLLLSFFLSPSLSVSRYLICCRLQAPTSTACSLNIYLFIIVIIIFCQLTSLLLKHSTQKKLKKRSKGKCWITVFSCVTLAIHVFF